MTKRFRGIPCVYCGAEGGTADHVFARKFLPVEHRNNLPQVSACTPCNNAKSQLEDYLLTLLPFGGDHPSSANVLTSMVPPRLENNRRLHRELAEGQQNLPIHKGAEARTALVLPFDGDRLEALLAFIAKGLVAHHWDSPIPPGYYVGGGVLTEHGDKIMRNLFTKNARARVAGNLGEGLILYQGAQAVDDPYLSVWRFRIYGDILFADPDVTTSASHSLWAITARKIIPGLFGH